MEFSQTARLFPPERGGPATAGDYISYDSHHFIRIEECPQNEEPPIRRVHYSLESLRYKQRNTKDANTHMVQSLTLLGEEADRDFGIPWRRSVHIFPTTDQHCCFHYV